MQKLIFLHITKTAGGSIKESLKKLKMRRVSFCDDTKKVKHVDTRTDLLFGHLVYGVHEQFDPDAKYIAFVRHPLTRTISHYYQLSNVDNSHIGNRIRQFNDINDFFARARHWEFENFLCKIISGEVNSGISESELLKKAIERIEQDYVFVGIQEFMQLSMLGLMRIFGETMKIDRNINIGRYDGNFTSKKTIETILRYNEADLSLYKHVVLKFLDNARSLGA